MDLFRYTVRVGEYYTNSDIDCGDNFCGLPVQDVTLSHVIVHPNYKQESYKDNVALLVLNSPINFTGFRKINPRGFSLF